MASVPQDAWGANTFHDRRIGTNEKVMLVFSRIVALLDIPLTIWKETLL